LSIARTGVLLINLGTPAAPTVSSVRHYLREFLSDPRVIDIPFFTRMLLLYGVILPFRSKKSAKAYQAIWTEHGSPLLMHSKALQAALGQIERQFGKGSVMRMGDAAAVRDIEAISTGSFSLSFIAGISLVASLFC